MKKIIVITIMLGTLLLNAKDMSPISTSNHYAKPGAPIEMKYTPQKVDVNQSAEVNITLSTSLTKGRLLVTVNVDEHLKSVKPMDENLSFEILPNQQTFLINLELKSQEEGLYYVRLLTKIDKAYGSTLRSFAVPVYVGTKTGLKKKPVTTQMKALNAGENITVSKAIETIEIIK